MSPYRTRSDELRALRRRVPKYRVPFPDLSVEQRTAPCSNRIVYTDARPSAACHPDAQRFPVGHLHKSGLQLVTEGMIKAGELAFMSGTKV